MTQHGTGVDLTLILASVGVTNVSDYQLPLPRAQVLANTHTGILKERYSSEKKA